MITIKDLDEWLNKTFNPAHQGRTRKGVASRCVLNPHVAVLIYFYRQPTTITNIGELSRVCNRAHPTMRRVVTDLVEAGILQEGVFSTVALKQSELTTAVLVFFRKVEEIIKDLQKEVVLR